ncbi:MAG: OmpA family protein [Bacteroidetes bacterium]|nr:OmpA family protein [Bacteroidota bacterium]
MIRLLIALVVLAVQPSLAQTIIDAGIAAGVNAARTEFSQLPGFPSCCPLYDGGTGLALGLNAGVEVDIGRSWYVGSRIGVWSRDHTLAMDEYANVIVGDVLTTATITHTIDVQLTEILGEFRLGKRLGRFLLSTGVGVGSMGRSSLSAEERLVDPNGATFTDTQTNVRNQRRGEIPDQRSVGIYALLSAGLDVPLSAHSPWSLSPEVGMQIGLRSITTAVPWDLLIPSFRLSVRYAFNKTPVETPDSAAFVFTPTQRQSELLDAPQNIVGVSLDVDVRKKITIEETERERFIPILPFLFFERNGDTLPARYHRRASSDPATVDESSTDFHHRLITVLAERLMQEPSATIVLTGTLCNGETDVDLARRRAEHVRMVLVQNYGINKQRIIVSTRREASQPTIGSGDESFYADEENRRVEVTTASPSLLLPYAVRDTLLSMSPPVMRIAATTPDNALLEEWSVNVGTTTVGSSDGPLRRTLTYAPSQSDLRTLVTTDSTSVIISGSHHGSFVADSVRLDVAPIRLFEKRRRIENDSIVEDFELIVFPFNSAEITDMHERVLALVRERIGAQARVVVLGTTDILGSASANMTLSTERARAVATQLRGNVTYNGSGEPSADVEQNLPEQRMLRRSVRIRAYVPIR